MNKFAFVVLQMTENLNVTVQMSYPACLFCWGIPVKSEIIKVMLLDDVL